MACAFTKRKILSAISIDRFSRLNRFCFNRSQNLDAWTLANQGGLSWSKGDSIIGFQGCLKEVNTLLFRFISSL